VSGASLNLEPSAVDRDRLLAGEHHDPHRILGAHPTESDRTGVVVRVYRPDATAAECLVSDGSDVALEQVAPGLFAGWIPGVELPLGYRLRFRFADGRTSERGDPYQFLPTVREMDLHLFNEGTHQRLWDCLGAHVREIDGVSGVSFAVWAPTARRVSVVGDFCNWDGRMYQMRSLGSSGIFELFIPDFSPDCVYKYEIKSRDGSLRLKTDPFAAAMEVPPATGSKIFESAYRWNDSGWMDHRKDKDPLREPMSIYEVHLGSWERIPEESNRSLGYREIARRLVAHVRELGFTHIELMPIAEHPFSGSWGYQVSGYFAPTARYGDPDDFRYLVDVCHQNEIGVLLDWVPAHFPRDDFALRQFDGTALYEYEDRQRAEHPDWGTLIFNYGRHEVRNFLMANALYWLDEFHIDGLRVDAVASMLYLDYSRKDGEWIPNEYGGRENLDAVTLLKDINERIAHGYPGCVTIAEESTAWPGVTRSPRDGGLGFTFKWNMGWMHDTLEYFKREPIHRRYHQDQLTFGMLYEYSERFIMPLSHDEVVHGKGSLLRKMPGDEWQKFANLRALLTYQYTRPGKQLLFMGTELAPDSEWNHDVSLDWHLADQPLRSGLNRFLADLGRIYVTSPSMWRKDPDADGFSWIDCSDKDNSVMSYLRSDGATLTVVVLNLTPVPRVDYRIGAPISGRYVEVLSSDDARYGGSEFRTLQEIDTDPVTCHGHAQSLALRLPPLGALVLQPTG
jgi:1,4-alpha-glucan branching enzyme